MSVEQIKSLCPVGLFPEQTLMWNTEKILLCKAIKAFSDKACPCCSIMLSFINLLLSFTITLSDFFLSKNSHKGSKGNSKFLKKGILEIKTVWDNFRWTFLKHLCRMNYEMRKIHFFIKKICSVLQKENTILLLRQSNIWHTDFKVCIFNNYIFLFLVYSVKKRSGQITHKNYVFHVI